MQIKFTSDFTKWFRFKILLIVFPCLAAHSSFSQTSTWLGGPLPGDTIAENPAFWSGGVLPTSTSDIIIPDDSRPLFISSNTTWASVTFEGGNGSSRLTVGPVFLTITGNIIIEDATANRDIRVLGTLDCAAIVGGTNTGLSGNRMSIFPGGTVTIPGDVIKCDLVMFGSNALATFGGNFTGGTVYAPYNSGEIPVIDFNSTDPQIVPAGTYGFIGFDGGGDKTLEGPVTVTYQAQFNNGIVINSSPIFFDGSFNGDPGVGATNDLSFATGPVRWVKILTSGSFTFPIGKPGSGYHPVTIDPLLISPTDFTVEYIRSSGGALGGISAPGIVGVSNCEYWNITRTVGGAADVTLTWSSSSGCNGTYIADPASLRVVHFNGSTWNLAGNAAGNGTATSGTVSWFGVTDFSPFTIGTTSFANPLPMTLTDLYANRCGNNICLYWKTASESNNHHFEIERSADGRQFNSIGNINGNGTTSVPHNYSFIDDRPLNGKNFYRIKQVNIDGKISYSSVIRINNNPISSFSASITPNPAGSVMNLTMEGVKENEKLVFEIININGMTIYRENISAGGTAMVKTLDRPGLRAGLYFYKITRSSNNETFTGKLVLQ